jgi:hypothetical protein
MRDARRVGIGIVGVLFLFGTVVAVINGDLGKASFAGVMTVGIAYSFMPKRPSDGSVEFRQAVLVALVIDGFALYVGGDFVLAVTGVTDYNSKTWADVPMFAIAAYIGYLVTLSTVRIHRGTFQPRSRPSE